MTDPSTQASRIELPEPPDDQRVVLASGGVACWQEDVTIDTYEPSRPDRYPLFLDRRVYQGSSGRVYPLPFTDRISPTKRPRRWRAIHLENEYVRLMLLPEIGGRIHVGFDKTTDYDFFYRNNVIKPALVGLAGPWISGGVEFNWPQHHRPATFLPVDTSIRREADGSVVVWHSDLDPLQRMRGVHGIRLRPGRSLVEADVRLFNRTDVPQTVLWWANVAVRAHAGYQSFFPPDVGYVADHARRAMTAFPRADRPYYGVDYPARVSHDTPDADRLDFPANIPVPTSYMVTDTEHSFFGGYDHDAHAGFVHWADRSIAPGKKQWTWGNGPVGWAWDALLTDDDGPYVELMAGVFTDNQPDFSFLGPGETRAFSQFWYPICGIGPALEANLEAAVGVRPSPDGEPGVDVGVVTTSAYDGAVVRLHRRGEPVGEWTADVAPGRPFRTHLAVPAADRGRELEDLRLSVTSAEGRPLARWQHQDVRPREPWLATEPDPPERIDSIDELLVTGTHLDQYRHPTRSGLAYFEEVLRRDPRDSRALLAVGSWHYRRGEYEPARARFTEALQRLTSRNLNPESGEVGYRLGLVLERLGDLGPAAAALAKAAWDVKWATPARLALARVELASGDAEAALTRLRAVRTVDAVNPTARHLTVVALRALGRRAEADAELGALLEADDLDPVALALAGRRDQADPKTPLIVAADLARAGDLRTALQHTSDPLLGDPVWGNPEPLRHAMRALWLERAGDPEGAREEWAALADVDTDYAFPYGLDEYDALVATLERDPDALVGTGEPCIARKVHALLGAWLLDAQRLEDALHHLERATALGSDDPVAWRNLAVAIVNTGGGLDAADRAYERALELRADVRLIYERDQLASLRGMSPAERLRRLEAYGERVLERHDLAVEYAQLLLEQGRAAAAYRLMTERSFQPFEGGEGKVLAAYDRACAEHATTLLAGDPLAAADLLLETEQPPASLGEGRHPASRLAHRLVVLGDALAAAGRDAEAREAWARARTGPGALAVDAEPQGPDAYWVGVAHSRLGEHEDARRMWERLDRLADALERPAPAPDYFATSVPELLLFNVSSDAARAVEARHLRDLARRGRALVAPAP